MSEEDQQLKDNLDLLVERAKDSVAGVQKLAIQSIANEIKTATSSMTSVPKPLKFLNSHYPTLKDHFASLPEGHEIREGLADVLSVLAMTSSPEGSSKESVLMLQSPKPKRTHAKKTIRLKTYLVCL